MPDPRKIPSVDPDTYLFPAPLENRIRALIVSLAGESGLSEDAVTALVTAALVVHAADTTAVHGVADTAQLATRSDISDALEAFVGLAPGALDTWPELVAAVQADQSGLGALITAVGLKANDADLAPVAKAGTYASLTGKPTIPTTPGQVDADPAGTAQGLMDDLDLSGYATTDALNAGLSYLLDDVIGAVVDSVTALAARVQALEDLPRIAAVGDEAPDTTGWPADWFWADTSTET